MSFAVPASDPAVPRAWDARLARRLVTPLKDSWVTPNHLTTVRLAVGLAAAAAFTYGTYGWSNLAALLLILSNFLDHTDGELARISGKTSRIGHLYDLASDAVSHHPAVHCHRHGRRTGKGGVSCRCRRRCWGPLAGCAIALIFFLRMRIEDMLGKAGTQTGRDRRIRDRRRAVSAAARHARAMALRDSCWRRPSVRRCSPSGSSSTTSARYAARRGQPHKCAGHACRERTGAAAGRFDCRCRPDGPGWPGWTRSRCARSSPRRAHFCICPSSWARR